MLGSTIDGNRNDANAVGDATVQTMTSPSIDNSITGKQY